MTENDPKKYFFDNKKFIEIDFTEEFEKTALEFYTPALEHYFNLRDVIKRTLVWVEPTPINEDTVLEKFLANFSFLYHEEYYIHEYSLAQSGILKIGDLELYISLLLEKLTKRLFEEGIIALDMNAGKFRVSDYNIPDPRRSRNYFKFILTLW